MSILKSLSRRIKSFFYKTPYASPSTCANCWGYQEWQQRQRDMVNDRQLDVKNGLIRYDFINKFVVSKVEGIRLRSFREV